MSNRRVKNVGYDDGDLDYDDDYEEEFDGGQEEVSAEDKEQLRLGTIEVRKSLDPACQATDQEIQDKLWDTYYDIGKTVSYIKSKHEAGMLVPVRLIVMQTNTNPSRHRQNLHNPFVS